MQIELTYHAKVERIDRLAECLTVLGMGKIMVQAKDSRYPGTVRQLTATGIVLVFDEKSNRLVTGYMATVAQMHMIYRQANIEKIPSKLYQRIHKNNDKFSYLHDFQGMNINHPLPVFRRITSKQKEERVLTFLIYVI